MQVVKDHIKLTMTGPAKAVEEGSSPEEVRDSYVTAVVARHFEAMWVHMRQGLDGLPAPHQRITDQVCTVAVCHHNWQCLFAGVIWPQPVCSRLGDHAQEGG